MRTGVVRYGKELDTLSYILHHIVGIVRHKTNACGLYCILSFVKSLSFVTTCYLAKSLVLSPNDKILDKSKLKACADDKINVAENREFFLGIG